MIWKNPITIQGLNAITQDTLVSHLGIEFIDFGDDFLKAKMPVDKRTIQPMGLLHGGASVSMAETMGSLASVCCIDFTTHDAVGIEINANHLSSVTSGCVTGTVTPIRIGRTIHVWNIDIRDENGKAICISRLTIAIIAKRS